MISTPECLTYYAQAGVITDPHPHAHLLQDSPGDVAALCEMVQGLLFHEPRADLYNVKLSSKRKQETSLRYVPRMLAQIRELDLRPLTVWRPPQWRLVGTSRDFAVMLCALLRHHDIPARVRVGFATYIEASMYTSHWVCEYWISGEERWGLADAVLDETHRVAYGITFDPCDVPRDSLVLAGDAWELVQQRRVDSRRFRSYSKSTGLMLVRGSVLQDIAALNKIELLPEDLWWDVMTRKDLAGDDVAYVDQIAQLTVGLDATFTALRSAFESDPLLHGPIAQNLRELDLESARRWGMHAQSFEALPQTRRQLARLPLPPEALARSSRQAGPAALEQFRPHRVDLDKIVIRGAHQHNLKHIDLDIPRNALVVITGVSGSGKSSLAFDTIYAEGQRRYVESLSPYARQHIEQMEKPHVDYIAGLSPSVAIEQKTVSRNPRSTVGTITEVINYVRLLFSRVGTPHCLSCGWAIEPRGPRELADQLLLLPAGTQVQILAPITRQGRGSYTEMLAHARQEGHKQVRIDGTVRDLNGVIKLSESKNHAIELVIGAVVVPEAQLEAQDPAYVDLIGLLKTGFSRGSGRLVLDLGDAGDALFTDRYLCPQCATPFPPPASGMFSANTPLGMCPDCNGLGARLEVDPALLVVNPDVSILDGAISWYGNLRQKSGTIWYIHQIKPLAEYYQVDLEQPWKDLPEAFRHALFYGIRDEGIRSTHYVPGRENDQTGDHRMRKGLLYNIDRLFHQTKSEETRRHYASFMSQQQCASCGGTRLRAEARAVRLGGKTISDISTMPIEQVLEWAGDLRATLTDEQLAIAEESLKEIQSRLTFMCHVGLPYLTLDRPAATLSGGEGQRIRLASQLSGGLVGVLYVLDEPSIGLHPRDQHTLIQTLLNLRDLGNSVLVVEHELEIMRHADWLIDLGPRAGEQGGEIIAAGPPPQVAADARSLTGRYLSGQLSIIMPGGRMVRPAGQRWLTIVGARLHNLRQITVRLPLGAMICVTGVSGSGKSSLISGTLYPALMRALHHEEAQAGPYDRIEGLASIDKVINITQAAIGRTPRSNPATYTGFFDDIRRLFAETSEAQKRGFQADRFSFNVEGGRCESCKGQGQKKIEMHFLADVWVVCKECDGARFNRETLAVRYKGKNIAQVLDMDIRAALSFFADQPAIRRVLQMLHDVGLDYIRIGQSATTLSGGESQRMKLARELSRVATGQTLYILDEPTVGLHAADIQYLLDVLHRLVDAGNTVLVIEHNLDIIRLSDWVIDLGPGGGDKGGTVVAEGPPAQIAQVEASYTGQFLRQVIERDSTHPG